MWDDFGIDWKGPVSFDDETTVTLNELLSPFSSSAFCQQEMLGKHAIAKSFVHQSYDNMQS